MESFLLLLPSMEGNITICHLVLDPQEGMKIVHSVLGDKAYSSAQLYPLLILFQVIELSAINQNVPFHLLHI